MRRITVFLMLICLVFALPGCEGDTVVNNQQKIIISGVLEDLGYEWVDYFSINTGYNLEKCTFTVSVRKIGYLWSEPNYEFTKTDIVILKDELSQPGFEYLIVIFY